MTRILSAIKPRVRLMLVDDHPLVRDGLRARLAAVPQFELVGEAGGGAEALNLAAIHKPDLMLVDISMKDMNGIRLTELLRERCPNVKVLILSMYDNHEYVTSAMRAGAKGYVLKDAGSQEIIAAIDAVAAGGSYYSATVASALVAPKPASDSLTDREREVLMLLAQGLSNKAVAQQLDISVRTAEAHRLSLRRKLGIDTAAGLVKYAMAQGWIKD
ncbi:response regulator transcription factor [Chitinivorax sp. B]|uniref:response regulator n=1 Tax=Chitinivorax sp. B TaxID=2502235 RepID=UPI0010F63432|nr:response regulator transcription factor [Chitinivorax sp. B]